jgi:hypothetical protein
LDNLDEPTPHLSYNGGRETINIFYRLLAAMTKMQVYNEMKIMMELKSCNLISQPKFYVMRNENFDNYKIHKSSAFSKCDTCIFLKLQLQIKKRVEERTSLLKDRSEHIQAQQSRQNLYYIAQAQAKEDPKNFLCIIHDKMDQNKTWPSEHDKMKSLSRSNISPLPISLTGMITYGQQPRMFAHYALICI